MVTGAVESRPRLDPEIAISVVMSARNEAAHIDAAIASVLGQSFVDFEFIIRDDGSTDGTGDLIEHWANRDARIRFFRGETSLGLAGAGNFVVRAARAPLVARMDADDIVHPDWLARLHQVIVNRPEVVLVGCLWSGMDSVGQPVREADRWRAFRPSLFPPFAHGSSLYRRDAWERTGGYRPECTYWEDYDLFLRIARQGKILVLPEVLYQYRFSANSTRRIDDQRQVERAIDVEFACVAAYRGGGDYEAVLAAATAPGERAGPPSARTLVALSYNRLWNGERPERIGRVIAATGWPFSRQAIAGLLLALASEVSPRMARRLLAAVIRLRAPGPGSQSGAPVEWNPLLALDPASAIGAFDLVAASCMPSGKARAQHLEAAANRPVDAQALVRLAAWHRVAPFVTKAVNEGRITLPPAAAQALATQAARSRFQAQRNAGEEARIAKEARASGLDLLFVKGATLAALVHRDPLAKSAWDIDVVIAPPDLPAARMLLEAIGYELQLPAGVAPGPRLDRWLAGNRESLWLNTTRGTAVELHLSLCESGGMLTDVGMASPRQQVIVDGEPVETLAEPELFAFLCVHGTSHGWARLKWLADVAALLAVSTRSPQQLHEAAVERGAGRCSGVALLLCQRLFGLALDPDLVTRLVADRTLLRLVDHSWRAMDRIGDPARRLGAETLREMIVATRLQYWLAPGLTYRLKTLWSQWRRPYAASQLALPPALLPLAMLIWLPGRLLRRLWRSA